MWLVFIFGPIDFRSYVPIDAPISNLMNMHSTIQASRNIKGQGGLSL